MSKKLTLTSLDKRQTKLESKVDEILYLLKQNKNGVSAPTNQVAIIDIESRKNSGSILTPAISFVEDEFDNKYTVLPVIYVAKVGDKIHVSLEEFEGATRIEPQQISTYKNSIDDSGKIRSVCGVAPSFNQMSMNKSDKFCKIVDAEQMTWETLFAYQLLVLASDKADEVLSIRQCESYNFNDERDCGFKDTSDNELLLGVDRLVTAGYTLFKCDNSDNDLFKLFCSLNDKSVPSTSNRFFGIVGDYGNCGCSPLLYLLWNVYFGSDWGGSGSARLCKPYNKGC